MFIEQISGQNIKIKFDINEKQLLLGDILKITASGKNGVLVQVIRLFTAEKNPNYNIAESKILYTIETSGKLTNWQGNIPSQDFFINKLSDKEVLLCSNTLNAQNPIPVGNLSLYPETEVNLEAAFFEKPTVIYCDKQIQKDNILSLLSCELSKTAGKTVLIDFNKNYTDLKVSLILEAGEHIKLPFDLKALELFYKKSLSESSPETKAVVEDILMEIENYLSAGEIEYIPFSSFKQAVDSVYKTNKLNELVLLKNKLSKLEKHGVFADKKQEIIDLNEKIKTNSLVIVDLSEFPQEWQKDLIENIVDSNTQKYKQKFFLLFDADKINLDKAFIENLFVKANKNGICPLITTGHESESAVYLLSYASNIIAFAPENKTKLSALQENLTRLKDNEAVITGKITNNVPLYINIYDTEAFEENDNLNISTQVAPEIYLSTDYEEETDIDLSTNQRFQEEYNEEEENNFNYSNQFNYDETGIELVENISKLQEDVNLSQKEELEEDSYEQNPEGSSFYDEEAALDYSDSEGLYEEDSYQESTGGSSFYDEETALDYSDSEELYEEDSYQQNPEGSSFYDEETVMDYSDSEELYEEDSYEQSSEGSSFYDEENYNDNAAKKYDSGFSEDDISSFLDPEEGNYESSYSSEQEQIDEDFDYDSNEEFQDESVLDYGDFYDEAEDQGQDSYGEENISNKTPMPDIPIYSTPKNESSADFDFQEGDKVRHEKYGIGTVTKIIGSNEKKLCSIQFEDVGKRLLDPNISDLQKI